MPFPFGWVCDLLSDVETITTRHPPLLSNNLKTERELRIVAWFQSYRSQIDSVETDGVALLSGLLPEKRVDRVYNLQSRSLTRTLGRCFCLGASRLPLLLRWNEPGGGDLGQCVERVLNQTPYSEQSRDPVTVEQIDAVLNEIATRSRFSGPDLRDKRKENGPVQLEKRLASIYCRLHPHEAKWFTRMLLKDYSPVSLPEWFVLRCFHPLLPNVLKVYDNLEAAVTAVRDPQFQMTSENGHSIALQERPIAPKCGVKIGRPLFLKAWSIKHAVKLANRQKMSLERKYDGEYCQIHVDRRNRGCELRIFSKSGKDSTTDRRSAHDTIKECLRLENDDCMIKRQCILEGELVVYSDKENKILPFHKLRKHIDRSGVVIGTGNDS
ncbi:hypothetical protein MMC19_001517 [Ptychographa xylographoides]|nr:hypothetical protein [Ptychographa xylographoides]